MEASAGLVAGSHNRNELVVIRRDGGGGGGVGGRRAAEAKAACQICGDDVGEGPDGEPFVACNECAFPVCRNCYDYERREGSQACPQCKTRFKRLKGCPRVAGDEEEDGVDDLEGEFGLDGREDDPQYIAESMLRANMSYGRGGDLQPFQPIPNVPLLTNGQMVDDIPPEQHALVPSYMGGGGGGGKRIHPLPFADPSVPGG
jgi:cellulose synthase A